ncbi:MAG: helix-turn-helix domain-containing protein [Candidatus Diapherotrites archaeon]|nr:helix-turn-helix domain-containing protein [Candidatus Diapherotrites archaeon]
MVLEKFKEVKLGVFHNDCYCSETTAKFPEIFARQTSQVNIYKRAGEKIFYKMAYKLESPDRQYLESYLDYVKKFPTVKSVKIFHKTNSNAYMLADAVSNGLTYNEILKKGIIYSHPVDLYKGYELHSFISTKPKETIKLINELKDTRGEVKILGISDIDENERIFDLTPNQMKVLKVALRSGYYEWPRKATLEEMASSIGLKRRTFQERLRKAENRLFPKLIKNYLPQTEGL